MSKIDCYIYFVIFMFGNFDILPSCLFSGSFKWRFKLFINMLLLCDAYRSYSWLCFHLSSIMLTQTILNIRLSLCQTNSDRMSSDLTYLHVIIIHFRRLNTIEIVISSIIPPFHGIYAYAHSSMQVVLTLLEQKSCIIFDEFTSESLFHSITRQTIKQ